MKQKMKKESRTLLLAVVICLVAAVAIALAVRHMKNKQLDNAYNDPQVSCAVLEESTDQNKHGIRVQNTGTTVAYIRVEVVASWKSAEGRTWAMKPFEGIDYTITLTEKNGWVKGADGYYYYMNAIEPIDNPKTNMVDETLTELLLSEAKQLKQGPEGVDGTKYSLAIEIVAYAIQATPDDVVGREWSNDKVLITGSNGALLVEEKKN